MIQCYLRIHIPLEFMPSPVHVLVIESRALLHHQKARRIKARCGLLITFQIELSACHLFLTTVAHLQVAQIQNEFASYKVRAHALLQKKDAELAAARDNEQLHALEEALKVDSSLFCF